MMLEVLIRLVLSYFFFFFSNKENVQSDSVKVQRSFFNLFCQANPLPHGLDKIPDVQGYLVLNSDGAVLAVSANGGYCTCLSGKT